MTDVKTAILSVVTTTANRLSDLSIKNGQLIFVKDRLKIALDYDNNRTFLRAISELQSDSERKSLSAPIEGAFYFVIDTAILWNYTQTWLQITTSPKEIISIGTSFPELGVENTLYIDSLQNIISIWNNKEKKYQIVADKSEIIRDEDILKLFE